MDCTLSALFLYPVKSCSPRPVASAAVEARGLRHDRRWMIVDHSGKFITGRQFPRLTRLQARPTQGGLELAAPGQPGYFLRTPAAGGERLTVSVWKGIVHAPLVAPEDDAWISAFLEHPARWVYMDNDAHRPVLSALAQPGDEVSFADGFPLMLLSEESLAVLNTRLSTPVSMLRFRPNLVVQGIRAHEEDGWRQVRIGSVVFDIVVGCKRCAFTNVDPDLGEIDPTEEPLRTLRDYRRTDAGVMFGMNVIARGDGTISVGDKVVPLA